MRALVLGTVLVLLAGGAAAQPPAAPPEDDFWPALIAPHAAEIEQILAHARRNRSEATTYAAYAGYDYASYSQLTRDHRARLLADAWGMLRYAARLNPDHREVALELALVADDAGRHTDAQAAFEVFLVREPQHADARARLGRLYARARRWDDAIAQYRLALADADAELRGRTLVLLGCAYMQSGRLSEAIDVLEQAAARAGHAPADPTALFALAVAYDRDEQLTRAHETLAVLLAADATLSYVLLPAGSQRALLVPPLEQHYFAALRYEVLGLLHEARAEWQAYRRHGDDALYRGRAAAHLAAVDGLLRERMLQPPPPAASAERKP